MRARWNARHQEDSKNGERDNQGGADGGAGLPGVNDDKARGGDGKGNNNDRCHGALGEPLHAAVVMPVANIRAKIAVSQKQQMESL